MSFYVKYGKKKCDLMKNNLEVIGKKIAQYIANSLFLCFIFSKEVDTLI